MTLIQVSVVLTVFFIVPGFGSYSGNVAERCFCKLKGEVDDCSCKVENVDTFNNLKVFPRLKSLLNKDFFRYWMVNLKRECPFWIDDSKCALRDCHVKTCSQEQLPNGLKEEINGKKNNSNKKQNKYTKEANEEGSCNDERNPLGDLDTTISDASREAFANWTKYDNAQNNFCELDDDLSQELQYVDLLLNPERYTGYVGPSAHRIWRSIYKENCFQPQPKRGYAPQKAGSNYLPHEGSGIEGALEGMCLEKRAFYRMVSGLHTSINIHLSAKYLLQDSKGYGTKQVWGHNVTEFKTRFDPETTNGLGPLRLKNLYFTYLVELRALAKAAPYLANENYFTGSPEDDADVKMAVKEILNIIKSFPNHFNEGLLFQEKTKEAQKLKEEFRSHFLNISRIMDCVGCDKCKLWGKLQITGMGTALKILFSGDDMSPESFVDSSSKKTFQLRRSEIVALFNAFGRLSHSIHHIEEFRQLLAKEA